MSIKELIEKGKSWERELFVSILVILVALLSFGLGRLSKIEGCREPIQIENVDSI
jgi:hypothetical protein